jgi:hypothetical protein
MERGREGGEVGRETRTKGACVFIPPKQAGNTLFQNCFYPVNRPSFVKNTNRVFLFLAKTG